VPVSPLADKGDLAANRNILLDNCPRIGYKSATSLTNQEGPFGRGYSRKGASAVPAGGAIHSAYRRPSI